MYKKHKILLSTLLALPLSNAYAVDDSSNNKKHIALISAEDIPNSLSEKESTLSDTETENKVEIFLHKLQSNFTLFTIKIRNKWDAKVATIAGLSLATVLCFILYMRSNGRRVTIENLRNELTAARDQQAAEKTQKDALGNLLARETIEKQQLEEQLRGAQVNNARRTKDLEDQGTRDAAQLREQQTTISELQRQNRSLTTQIASVDQQIRTKLGSYATQLNEIIERLKDVDIPKIEDDPYNAPAEINIIIQDLATELEKLRAEPQEKRGWWPFSRY